MPGDIFDVSFGDEGDGFGITVIGTSSEDEGNKHGYGIFIDRISPDSPASNTGSICPGLQITSVDGTDLDFATIEDFELLLQGARRNGFITLSLRTNDRLLSVYQRSPQKSLSQRKVGWVAEDAEEQALDAYPDLVSKTLDDHRDEIGSSGGDSSGSVENDQQVLKTSTTTNDQTPQWLGPDASLLTEYKVVHVLGHIRWENGDEVHTGDSGWVVKEPHSRNTKSQIGDIWVDVKFDTCRRDWPVKVYNLYLPDARPPLPNEIPYGQRTQLIAPVVVQDKHGSVHVGDVGEAVGPSHKAGEVLVKFDCRSVHLSVPLESCSTRDARDSGHGTDVDTPSIGSATSPYRDLISDPPSVRLYVLRNGHFGGGGPHGDGIPISAKSLGAAISKATKKLRMSKPARVLYDFHGNVVDNGGFTELKDGDIVFASTGGAFKDPLQRPVKFLAHKNGQLESCVKLISKNLGEALDACTTGLSLGNPAQRLFLYDGTEIKTTEAFIEACRQPKEQGLTHMYASTGGPCILPVLGSSLAGTSGPLGFPELSREDGRTATESEHAIRVVALVNGSGIDSKTVPWKPIIAAVDRVAPALAMDRGDVPEIAIGDRVKVVGLDSPGVVRFVGTHPTKRCLVKTKMPTFPPKYEKQRLVGVELDSNGGTNSGEVQGVRYFSLPEDKEGKDYGWLGTPEGVVHEDASEGGTEKLQWDMMRLKADLTKSLKLSRDASRLYTLVDSNGDIASGLITEVDDSDTLPQMPDELWCIYGKGVHGPVWAASGDSTTTGAFDINGLVQFFKESLVKVDEKLNRSATYDRPVSPSATKSRNDRLQQFETAKSYILRNLRRAKKAAEDAVLEFGSLKMRSNSQSDAGMERLCPASTNFLLRVRRNAKEIGDVFTVRIDTSNAKFSMLLEQISWQIGLARPARRLFFRDEHTDQLFEASSLSGEEGGDEFSVGIKGKKKRIQVAGHIVFTVSTGDSFVEYINQMICLEFSSRPEGPALVGDNDGENDGDGGYFLDNESASSEIRDVISKGWKHAKGAVAAQIVAENELSASLLCVVDERTVVLAPTVTTKFYSTGSADKVAREDVKWCNFLVDRRGAEDSSGRDVGSFAAFLRSKLVPSLVLTELPGQIQNGGHICGWSKRMKGAPEQLWTFHGDGSISSLASLNDGQGGRILTSCTDEDLADDRLRGVHYKPPTPVDGVPEDSDSGEVSERNTGPMPILTTERRLSDKRPSLRQRWGFRQYGNNTVGQWKLSRNSCVEWQQMSLVWPSELPKFGNAQDDTLTPLPFNELLIWPMEGVLINAAPWVDNRALLAKNMPRTTAKVEAALFIKIQIQGQNEAHAPLLLRVPNSLTSHCEFETTAASIGEKLAESAKRPMPINTREYIMRRSAMYLEGKEYGHPNTSLTTSAGLSRSGGIRSADSTISSKSALITPLEQKGIELMHTITLPTQLVALLEACTSALGLPANKRATRLLKRDGSDLSESDIANLQQHQLLQVVPKGAFDGLDLSIQQLHLMRTLYVERCQLLSLETSLPKSVDRSVLLQSAAEHGVCSAALFGDESVEQACMTVPDGSAIYPLFANASAIRMNKICTACFRQLMQLDEASKLQRDTTPVESRMDTPFDATANVEAKFDRSTTIHKEEWNRLHYAANPANHALLIESGQGHIERVVDPWEIQTRAEGIIAFQSEPSQASDADQENSNKEFNVTAQDLDNKKELRDLLQQKNIDSDYKKQAEADLKNAKPSAFVCSAFLHLREQIKRSSSMKSQDGCVPAPESAVLWPRSAFLAARVGRILPETQEFDTTAISERLVETIQTWDAVSKNLRDLREELQSKETTTFYASQKFDTICHYNAKEHSKAHSYRREYGLAAQTDSLDVTSRPQTPLSSTKEWIPTVEKIARQGNVITLRRPSSAKDKKESTMTITVEKMTKFSTPPRRFVTVQAWWSGDNHETVPPCRAKGRDLEELLDSCAVALRTQAKRPQRIFRFESVGVPPVEVTKDNWTVLKSNDMIFVTTGSRYLTPQEAAERLKAKGRVAREVASKSKR